MGLLSRHLSCFLGKPHEDSGANFLSRHASGLPEDLCRRFSLDEIRKATNNFSQQLIIAGGGVGRIYKGRIDDGAIAVAVKHLASRTGYKFGEQEYSKEVQLLCQLRHPNLISLIGFCDAKREMFLVFEYMSKGALDQHLYSNNINDPLPWKQRLRICIGAARGLHYLHSGAKYAIIHRDVKGSNILLDDKLEAKLSDFGLYKMGPLSMSKALIRKNSAIVGTLGYLDPEYAKTGELTEKSDVFSFGVVLFEVLCGRRRIDGNFPSEQDDLVQWVINCKEKGILCDIIDPVLMGKIAPACLKTFIEIASSCLHYQGKERPSMGEVEATLELALELQETADAEMEAINPAGQYIYEYDGISFCDWEHIALLP